MTYQLQLAVSSADQTSDGFTDVEDNTAAMASGPDDEISFLSDEGKSINCLNIINMRCFMLNLNQV